MFAASKTDSASTGGYQISRSLRFNQPDSAYLARTPASAGSRTTWTLSGWFKGFKSNLNNVIYCAGSGANQTGLYIDSANQQLNFYEIQSSSTIGNLVTTQVFRDYSAWYHIVAVYDSTQATASSRMRLYVNGTQVTAFGTATYVSQNTNSIANSAVITEFGNGSGNAAFYDGYMTEIYFVDGQALTASSFGETNAQTGVWQPKAYSGSYGTNGFYLNFSDNSNTTAATLGKDYSGNGNNWTPNNFSVTAGAGNDSLVDSPTSYGTDTGVGGTVRGNYATLNVVNKGSVTLTNGNLDATATGNTGISYSTIGMSSGKWYWEVTCVSGAYMVGIGKDGGLYDFRVSNGYGYFYFNGQKYNNNTGTSYGATFTTGDVIGVGLDMDAGTLTFYKNGTSQGTAYSGLTGTWFANTQDGSGGGTAYNYNFGQRPFAYTAPSGYKALCTQNLPTPTIGATSTTLANKYFAPVIYTGNGDLQSVTVGFQPDWVWLKSRSVARDHRLMDTVRGINNVLQSNSTAAEYAGSALSSINSSGFTLNSTDNQNVSSETYGAWNWKANGSGSTNTSGSITSTVSANTTSGFSVVTYTGNGNNSTVGHGLGIAPSMVIIKSRSAVQVWVVGHSAIGFGNYLLLNTTDASASGANVFNSTAPTSTVFSLGVGAGANTASATYVAYCFAPVSGYSAFGSYTGNGSADGPFIYTGFRPAYLLVKRSDSTYDWWVFDNKRLGYNATSYRLAPDLSDAEYTTGPILDLTSNGFKIRDTSQGWNGSGGTIIFAAFAESPFKYSLAR